MTEKQYIQIILPLKLSWEPWYSAPDGLYPGKRVNVLFGHRQYIGVVHTVSDSPDVSPQKISPIISVAEGLWDITENELKLWEFISSYYLCSIGEVYKAAYPAGKLFSEQKDPRSMERLKERMDRLDAQILAREGKSRCRTDVTEKLRAERDALAGEMESLRKTVPSVTGGKRNGPAAKPLLLRGAERLDRYLQAMRESCGDILVLTPDFIRADALHSALSAEFPNILRTDSRQTAVQRRKAADSLRDGRERHIVLGTRTSIFLPFGNLSLVIIDEEQDVSYKQEDPAPRYNGRDCAVQLAHIHSASVILGSGSPSLDSLYNVSAGKYRLEHCPSPSDRKLEIVDVGVEARKNGMLGALSRKVLEAAAGWNGSVILIRGWEKEEELNPLLAKYLPHCEVLRYREAREKDLSDALVVVLQADALVKRDDFRADEKAIQLVDTLGSRCSRLIVQTSVRGRFDGSRSAEDLLKERKEFGFPPYSRLVEVRNRNGSSTNRVFLAKDSSLSEKKARLKEKTGAESIIDVDPI